MLRLRQQQVVAVGFGASSLGFLELSGLAGLEHLPSDPGLGLPWAQVLLTFDHIHM